MERMELYKSFRVRAYQDWSGQWLAETKKPVPRRPGASDHDDTDAEYIVIKQMIDSPSPTIQAPKKTQ
jgi:hypothetical protein